MEISKCPLTTAHIALFIQLFFTKKEDQTRKGKGQTNSKKQLFENILNSQKEWAKLFFYDDLYIAYWFKCKQNSWDKGLEVELCMVWCNQHNLLMVLHPLRLRLCHEPLSQSPIHSSFWHLSLFVSYPSPESEANLSLNQSLDQEGDVFVVLPNAPS